LNTRDLEGVNLDLVFDLASGQGIDKLAVLIRDGADFESMESLDIAIASSQALKIDMPEADYGHLASLAECRRYPGERLR
jgi:hypothetical protein